MAPGGLRARHAGIGCADRARRPGHRRTARQGQRRHRRRPRQLGRVVGCHHRCAGHIACGRSRCQSAARLPSRERCRRTAGWLPPRQGGPRHTGHIAGRSGRQDRLPGAAGRRPTGRLPRHGSGTSCAGRCSPHHCRRHVPYQVVVARQRRVGCKRLRRESRYHHQSRGSGEHGCSSSHARRFHPTRLDDCH